jgi:hypothetical protein
VIAREFSEAQTTEPSASARRAAWALERAAASFTQRNASLL